MKHWSTHEPELTQVIFSGAALAVCQTDRALQRVEKAARTVGGQPDQSPR